MLSMNINHSLETPVRGVSWSFHKPERSWNNPHYSPRRARNTSSKELNIFCFLALWMDVQRHVFHPVSNPHLLSPLPSEAAYLADYLELRVGSGSEKVRRMKH